MARQEREETRRVHRDGGGEEVVFYGTPDGSV